MRFAILPESAGSEAGLLILARALRGFGDGLISLTLPAYLIAMGFDAVEIGILVTSTLLGSSLMTLAMGWAARRFPGRTLLISAALLMTVSAPAFLSAGTLWPLAVIAFFGTLNPSAGESSLFLPIEQARLAHSVADRDRTALFSRYSFFGSMAAAFGALATALAETLGRAAGLDPLTALRAPFLLYAALGLAILFLYARLPRQSAEPQSVRQERLGKSRRFVLVLTALFSLDAFAGGFVVQSLLALWLFERFGLDLATAGTLFFWIGVLSAFSFLAAPFVARRLGLVNTMVFTHLPASVCLALVPFMPTLALAITLLLARSLLAQMDVPTRASYVMAIVSPAERAAAASLTAVPRSLAAAASPALAGALLGASGFGWPLVVGGGLKVVYDLLLLYGFRSIRPSEEVAPLSRPATTPLSSATAPERTT